MKKYVLISLMVFLGISLSFGQLPSVKVKNLDGKTIETSSLNNNGKPFIISFFATWCKPCLRELKAIHEVYADWVEETGVKVIAVSIDEGQNAMKVKPMVDNSGWEYEVLLDTNGEFKRAMGVNVVPSVFVVDGKGKIVSSRTGYTDGSEAHLLESVKELLAK